MLGQTEVVNWAMERFASIRNKEVIQLNADVTQINAGVFKLRPNTRRREVLGFGGVNATRPVTIPGLVAQCR